LLDRSLPLQATNDRGFSWPVTIKVLPRCSFAQKVRMGDVSSITRKIHFGLQVRCRFERLGVANTVWRCRRFQISRAGLSAYHRRAVSSKLTSARRPGAGWPTAGLWSGVRHFALWPLSTAAESCFGTGAWPDDTPAPHV
jgi:hypothetical protein